ncbi:MAG: hypothetical protein IPJ69_13065 [Deltaproteobacteria bacterium]|nr:MAG: hypothetical protein IPJ69_13065 [Deltaproteobacteria bacterium]
MKKVLISAAALLLLSSVSFAHEGKKDGPCHVDAETFCKDVKPGKGRIAQCMKEHKSELSPECRGHIEDKKEKVKDRIESCEADRQKFCSDVKGGKRRMNKCMREHKDKLSQDCRDFFK